MTSFRTQIGAFAGRFIPGLGDRVFNRDRDRSVPASRAPRGGHAPARLTEREAHILVVPIEGPQFADWAPGTRNFYYEAWQSGRELFGESCVSVLDIAPGEDADIWHRKLRDAVFDTGATHIVTHIEHDPGTATRWTWDTAWNQLAPRWDGALLGVHFDSAYDLVTMKSRRLARMSPNFLAVDICTPLDGVLVRGRTEAGPVTMPMSTQSMQMVQERLRGITPTHDVSFIGALYPYRVELIERIRAAGIDIAVNPHRADVTHDFASSRKDQPSWLDYMQGLASSRMTINFSRSSAGGFEQLKTRVIEATLAGTFLLTDDVSSTRRFFTPEVEYGHFPNVEALPAVIADWAARESDRSAGAASAQEKAVSIAHLDFWAGIAQGLERRHLPALPPFLEVAQPPLMR